MLLVVGGIATAILAASSVSTRSAVSIDGLADDPKLVHERDEITRAEQTLLAPDKTVGDFRKRYLDALVHQDEAFAGYREAQAKGAPGTQLDPLRGDADRASRVVVELTAQQNNIVGLAAFLRVARLFSRSKRWMATGVVLAALGLIAFAWGANPESGPDLAAGEVLPKTPSEVVVRIDDDSRADFETLLGSDCDLGAVDAIATGAKGDTYTVVSLQTPTCKSALLEVGPSEGQVLTAAEEASETEPTAAPPGTPAIG